jgi:PHD/YefM family antitoxin component YafN of YafNO toxin-antitoxin module
MKRTHRPLVLTVGGKAELIVQDAEDYKQILERLDRLEAVDAIRVGIEDAKAGRVRPAREALRKLQEKLGISD